jgi:L-aspartate oxidase
MWRLAGLERAAAGLAEAIEILAPVSRALEDRVASPQAASTEDFCNASLALVGQLVAQAAERRQESRGGHRRADFPERDDVQWKVHMTDKRM